MRRKVPKSIKFHFFNPSGSRVEAIGRTSWRGRRARPGQWWVKVVSTKTRPVMMPVDDLPDHWVFQLAQFGPRKGNLP